MRVVHFVTVTTDPVVEIDTTMRAGVVVSITFELFADGGNRLGKFVLKLFGVVFFNRAIEAVGRFRFASSSTTRTGDNGNFVIENYPRGFARSEEHTSE